MAIKPKGKVSTEHIGFRCPKDLIDWAAALGPNKSQNFVWALDMGRQFADAGRELQQKLDGYSALLGIDRGELVKKVLELGMAAFEREQRSRK